MLTNFTIIIIITLHIPQKFLSYHFSNRIQYRVPLKRVVVNIWFNLKTNTRSEILRIFFGRRK